MTTKAQAAAQPNERRPGTFRPGPDPRRVPRGKGIVPRLSDGRTLYELAREYTEDALCVAAAVMHDPNEQPELRLKAAALILTRGWGDAPKNLNLSLDAARTALEMSDADVAALVFAAGSPPPAALAAGPPSYNVVDGELVQPSPAETPGHPDRSAVGIAPPEPFHAVDSAPESKK